MPPGTRNNAAADEGESTSGDHRVRFAKVRRERMRAHLLKSVMAVYPEGGAGSRAVIDDVVRHADVSRGTFYKYFDSLSQAVAELGSQLAGEMTASANEVYSDLTEPAMRTATGFMLYLLRAHIDHRWGAFISHIGLLTKDNLMVRYIQKDIELGIETGDYLVASPSIASDVLVGAKIEALRRIVTGQTDLAYIRAIATMVLRSFGLPRAKSEKVVERAFDRLLAEAPQQLDWWKPIEN